jgi:glutathione synthase
MDKVPESIQSFYKKVMFEKKLKALHVFDCMMIRKDLPINPLVLNFLDAIAG